MLTCGDNTVHLHSKPPWDDTQALIAQECDRIKVMLLEKNRSYGDSALSPLRIFSRADTDEQLLVRIDDKLSRIARGNDYNEDTVADLIGYLILLRVSRQKGE